MLICQRRAPSCTSPSESVNPPCRMQGLQFVHYHTKQFTLLKLLVLLRELFRSCQFGHDFGYISGSGLQHTKRSAGCVSRSGSENAQRRLLHEHDAIPCRRDRLIAVTGDMSRLCFSHAIHFQLSPFANRFHAYMLCCSMVFHFQSPSALLPRSWIPDHIR